MAVVVSVPQPGANFQRSFVKFMEKHGILLVVAGALVDLKGPVDLLQKHHPCQVVGEGHGGHRELEPGLLLDGGVQAIGAADEKDQMLGGGLLPIGHDLGQFLTGAQLSFHTEGYQTGAGRKLGADGVGLLGQSLVDLALGGVLGQLLLGQLGEGELTVAAQPLFVLLAGLQIELLLQLSHADEMNAQHTAASCLTPWRER